MMEYIESEYTCPKCNGVMAVATPLTNYVYCPKGCLGVYRMDDDRLGHYDSEGKWYL